MSPHHILIWVHPQVLGKRVNFIFIILLRIVAFGDITFRNR